MILPKKGKDNNGHLILYLKLNPYSYSFAIPHYEYLGDEMVLICQLFGVHKNPFEAEFTI